MVEGVEFSCLGYFNIYCFERRRRKRRRWDRGRRSFLYGWVFWVWVGVGRGKYFCSYLNVN